MDARLVEALHALNAYSSVMPAILARPPLSSAALRLVRVSMSQSQHVVDVGLELAVGTSLLQCREESDSTPTCARRCSGSWRATMPRKCSASLATSSTSTRW